jgi:spore maturation protein CgeB
LKIVVIGPHFTDSFARNICVTLEAMGHEVVAVPGIRTLHYQGRWARAFWTLLPKAMPAVEKHHYSTLIREVDAAKPDFILVTIGSLPPETVESLRKLGHGPVVCWYTDPMANWTRQYLLAAPWDAIFLKEPWAVRLLRDQLDQPAFYLPEAMNPMWHRRCEGQEHGRTKYRCDLLAQGTLHYYRARMLEPFIEYDLKIWGSNAPAWLSSKSRQRYTGEFIGETTKSCAFSSAKIALNILSHQEIEGVNCSLFEYAGCGLFQITQWKPTLEELFKPEKEVVTYRNRTELKEKVDFYSGRPDLRAEISDRAYCRAHAEHTYQVRLRNLINTISASN